MAECALEFSTPFQLLVATILSAQCTDKQVNKTTPALFAAYPDAASMAQGELSHIEELVKSIGLYKSKAKNIKGAATDITLKFGGVVPNNMDDLVSLPGVGRKTANVVLGNAYGVPGMVVDTHVKRISNRFGLTKNQDPEKIEADLMKIIPKEEWTDFSHRLVLFGRSLCSARKPDCINCKVSNICPSAVK
ncbi:MAG: endonuclease III [Deferribacterales bacterium]|nr:endonuclease III [Deferribacterales bacterium]